eukprot:5867401-Prymnesium_polylepis.3
MAHIVAMQVHILGLVAEREQRRQVDEARARCDQPLVCEERSPRLLVAVLVVRAKEAEYGKWRPRDTVGVDPCRICVLTHNKGEQRRIEDDGALALRQRDRRAAPITLRAPAQRRSVNHHRKLEPVRSRLRCTVGPRHLDRVLQ